MPDPTIFQIDIEVLKLFGAIFALFVSTVTVQFKLAEFINKKRDQYPMRRRGKWSTFGEIYDWAWCYVLGVLVNLMFLAIAWKLRAYTSATEYSSIGTLLVWIYAVNLGLWVAGFVIDAIRHGYPGTKSKETV